MGYNVNKPDPTEVARFYVEQLEREMTLDDDPANDVPVEDLLAIYDEVTRRAEVQLGPALAAFKSVDPRFDYSAAPYLPWVAAVYVSMPDPEWLDRFSPNAKAAARRLLYDVLAPDLLCTSKYYLERNASLTGSSVFNPNPLDVRWHIKTYDKIVESVLCLETIDDMDWRTYLDVEMGLGPDRLLSLQAYLHPRETLFPRTDSSSSLVAQAFRNALGR